MILFFSDLVILEASVFQFGAEAKGMRKPDDSGNNRDNAALCHGEEPRRGGNPVGTRRSTGILKWRCALFHDWIAALRAQ